MKDLLHVQTNFISKFVLVCKINLDPRLVYQLRPKFKNNP